MITFCSKRYWLLPIVQLVVLTNMIGQSLKAIDNPDVRIFPQKNPQHEVHISINKTRPNNLIVSANTKIGTRLTQGHYFSKDGGITWNGGDEMPNNREGRTDPSTTFDALGRCYISTMDNDRNTYLVQFSDDQGTTWSDSKTGTNPKPGLDKEMIAADDMPNSPFTNHFYCAWMNTGDNDRRVFFNRSTDRANSFSKSINLSNKKGQGANVQTGPDGEVYVCWAGYPNATRPATQIGFAVSVNGGVSFGTTVAFEYNGIMKEGANSNFGNTEVNDFPAMAVDKSCGPNRGRIYIAYPEFESFGSSKSVIRVRFSDDKGNTWVDRSTLSEPNHRQSWFPWIAIDDLTGVVSVVYYAFDTEKTDMTNTYLSFTKDGKLWSRIKVSDVGHITAPIPNMGAYAGDYIGVASFGGIAYVGWSDNREDSNLWQVYVSKVDFNAPVSIASQADLVINEPRLITKNRKYQAINAIKVATTQPVTISSVSNIELVAGKEIMLYPGFSTVQGASFLARIADVIPCTTPGTMTLKKNPPNWQAETEITKDLQNEIQIFAYPNPAIDYITVGCINNKFKEIHFSITDVNGKKIYDNVLPDLIGRDQIRKIFDVSMLRAGFYIVTIQIDEQIFSTKFIKQ